MKLVPIIVGAVFVLVVAGFIIIANSEVKIAQSPTLYDIPLDK